MQIVGPGASQSQTPQAQPNPDLAVSPELAARKAARDKGADVKRNLDLALQGKGPWATPRSEFDPRRLTDSIVGALKSAANGEIDTLADKKIREILEKNILTRGIEITGEVLKGLTVVPEVITRVGGGSPLGSNADATLEAELDAKRIADAKAILNMPPMWRADP